jgi:MOSC domain-containing protein YiiM
MAGSSAAQGTLLQVNISKGGLPKSAISEGLVTPLGLDGDMQAHTEFHGGPEKAILLIAEEIIEELKSQGYPLFRGAMGENLTTSGIDIRALRIGDRLRVGEVELELTKVRKPCRQLHVYGETLGAAIFDRVVKEGDASSPRWGMSGFYAKVITPGRVQPGDIISIVAL